MKEDSRWVHQNQQVIRQRIVELQALVVVVLALQAFSVVLLIALVMKFRT